MGGRPVDTVRITIRADGKEIGNCFVSSEFRGNPRTTISCAIPAGATELTLESASQNGVGVRYVGMRIDGLP
jgi:hypothetical protein